MVNLSHPLTPPHPTPPFERHPPAAEARRVSNSLSWQIADGLFRSFVKDGVAGVKHLDIRRLEIRRQLPRKASDLEVGHEGLEHEVFRVQHLGIEWGDEYNTGKLACVCVCACGPASSLDTSLHVSVYLDVLAGVWKSSW